MDVDRMFDDAVAMGRRNQETIELARRHCIHMEFREWELGGRGMAEAATGLPINTRRVHCAYAPHSGNAGANLDWITSEFYKKHCRGCPHRRSTGELPNLATTIEAREDELVAAASRERKRLEALRENWKRRVEHRRALRAAGAEPPMQSALDDLELIDADPTVQADAEVVNSAVRRLVALADGAPDTYSLQVIEHTSELAEHLHLHNLLAPLRHVARSRPKFRFRVVAVALTILCKAPDVEAARCLVDLSAELDDLQLQDGVIESLIMLAGQPELDEFGHPTVRSARSDPAGLRVVADREPGAVKAAIRRFLRRRKPQSDLVLPAGLRSDLQEDSPSDLERCAAAGAIRCLSATHEELAKDLIDDLIANLADDDADMYGPHPVADNQHTLAVLLTVCGPDVVAALERAGEQASDDYRGCLFGVIERACHLDRWRAPGDPVLGDDERRCLHSLLISASFRRLDGTWGVQAANKAASIIEDLASEAPGSMVGYIPALFGALLLTIDSLERHTSGRLALVETPFSQLRQLDEEDLRLMKRGTAYRLSEAIKTLAAKYPVEIRIAVEDILQAERANNREIELAWRLLPVLGHIGGRYGDEAGLLRGLFPTLHTYLLHSNPSLRAAAIKAWTEIAQQHPTPSSLSDLLPVLLSDRYLVVINALLGAAVRIEWSDQDTELLLRYALNVASAISPSHHKTLKKALETARALAGNHRAAVEAMVLRRAADLDGYDLRDTLRGKWLDCSRQSAAMARLRLRLACDPRINDRINSRDQKELTDLLDCGVGLVELPQSDFVAAALEWCPKYPNRAAEFAEALWRAGRPADAAALMETVLFGTPNERVYAVRRAMIDYFLAAAHLDAELLKGAKFDQAVQKAAEEIARAFSAGEEDDSRSDLAIQTVTRIGIRCLLSGSELPETSVDLEFLSQFNWSSFSRDPATRLRDRADRLATAGQMLGDSGERRTATGAYVRAIASLCEIGAQLLRFDAAELEADESRGARLTAAQRRAATELAEIRSLFGDHDPLGSRIVKACEQIAAIRTGSEVLPLLCEWAILPMPLLIIHGPERRSRSYHTRELVEADEGTPSSRPVAVVLAYIDDRLVTGAQVLRPGMVYTLRLDLRLGEWPGWAERLHAEFLSHLTVAEAETPTFTWQKPGPRVDSDLLKGEGTLVLRFGLAAGRPAPPFLLSLRIEGQHEGNPRQEVCDIAGHRELRLRPFDPSRDSLTSFPVFDELLLELYEDLHGVGYNEEHIQAFCRLFTAVCRAGLPMTWEKRYKLGQRVTEREFHDDLHIRLLSDPELGGRVDRNKPLALGYLDIRHDGITAELKVERKVPVTKERAPKYMGQPTQYAAADGARLSILCILDMSPKERPVGTPENYLWWIQPALHGLTNPEAPSLVAVLVVNGSLSVPSAWPRKPIGSHTIMP
jgi:hypothetical protein